MNLLTGASLLALAKSIYYLLPLQKGHLYSGENDTFSGSRNLDLTSIQGTLNTQNVTDQENRSLIIYGIHSSQ